MKLEGAVASMVPGSIFAGRNEIITSIQRAALAAVLFIFSILDYDKIGFHHELDDIFALSYFLFSVFIIIITASNAIFFRKAVHILTLVDFCCYIFVMHSIEGMGGGRYVMTYALSFLIVSNAYVVFGKKSSILALIFINLNCVIMLIIDFWTLHSTAQSGLILRQVIQFAATAAGFLVGALFFKLASEMSSDAILQQHQIDRKDLTVLALAILGSKRGGICWVPSGQPACPAINVQVGAETKVQGVGSCKRGFEISSPRPMLYQRGSSVGITLKGRHRFEEVSLTQDDIAFFELHGIDRGVLLPLIGAQGQGRFVYSLPSFCGAWHLRFAEAIATHLGIVLDRQTAVAELQGRAIEKEKLSLARDLHDTVAQSLAGARFWIGSIKAKVRVDERQLADELDELGQCLFEEHAAVKDVIAALRGEGVADGQGQCSRLILRTCERLSAQWRINAVAEIAPSAEKLPLRLVHELQQILREGVSNAARHGSAKLLQFDVRVEADLIRLAIRDDGEGFDASQIRPMTIVERVHGLGGSVDVSSEPGETVITAVIPVGGA